MLVLGSYLEIHPMCIVLSKNTVCKVDHLVTRFIHFETYPYSIFVNKLILGGLPEP
jgi:hypothetical protein